MTFKRILAILLVYLITCASWMILLGVNESRTADQGISLMHEVGSLWGHSQRQKAPTLSFRAVRGASANDSASKTISAEEAERLKLSFPKAEAPKKDNATTQEATPPEEELLFAIWDQAVSASPSSSTIRAQVDSDPRRKGLVWFALYGVNFDATYTYQHQLKESGYLDIEFALPSEGAIYDDLVFEVDGKDHKGALDLASGIFKLSLPVQPGSLISIHSAYKTRGADEWSYRPGDRVQQLDNFKLTLITDFADIDFPEGTQSPSSRVSTDDGWTLDWSLSSTVTGQGMGVLLPQALQPGEISGALILSAPVSLLFFFVILFILATLQKLDIHPMNYLFIGAAFFAFHLLFSYSADHLTIQWAFVLCSVVSLFLVISYLRLVVSPRFAVRQAGLAQLIYLVGFSLAHFWAGFTGLTVTVLAILTLYVVMQATGRLSWSEVFKATPKAPQPANAPRAPEVTHAPEEPREAVASAPRETE